MAKQNLLLVDADLRSVRVLEMGLRKSGYGVVTASNGRDALEMLEFCKPDLVVCDTRLPQMDGFTFINELRQRSVRELPVVVLSSDPSVEAKVRCLELGVDDYLTKPIYIKDVLARVGVVLQSKRREGSELRANGAKQKFTGSLSDIGVIDLLQTIDNSKKSGVLLLSRGEQQGAIYFRNGQPMNAELDHLRGARAVYRALVWTDGNFEIDFGDVHCEDTIQTRTQGLLMEGMRRVDEWSRLLENLPSLDTIFALSDDQLYTRLAEIPDNFNPVLRQIDGELSMMQIVDACNDDDVEILGVIAQLYFETLVVDTGRRAAPVAKTDQSAVNPSQPPDPELLAALVLPHGESQVPPRPSQPPKTPVPTNRVSSPALAREVRTDRPVKNPQLELEKQTVRPPSVEQHVDQRRPEPAPQRPTRFPKPHKRKKRLSLTNSPGLLSTRKLEGQASALEQALAADPNQSRIALSVLNQPQLKLKTETGAWLDTLHSPTPERPTHESRIQSSVVLSQAPSDWPAPTTQAPTRASVAAVAGSVGSAGSVAPAAERRRPAVPPAPGIAEQPAAPRATKAPSSVQIDRSQSVGQRPQRRVHESSAPSRASAHDELDEVRVLELRQLPPTTPPEPSARSGTRWVGVAIGLVTVAVLFAVAVTRLHYGAQPQLRAVVQSPDAPEHESPLHVEPSPREHAQTPPPSAPVPAPTVPEPEPTAPATTVARPVGTVETETIGAETPLPTRPREVPLERPQSQPSAATPPTPPARAREASLPPAERAPIVPDVTPTQPPAHTHREPAANEPTGAAPTTTDRSTQLTEESIATAQELESQGKTKQAMDVYENAIAQTPQSSALLSRLAFMYLNQGRPADAIAYASRAIQADPSNSEAWIVLGAGRYEMGDRKAAKEAYRSCAEQGRGAYVVECKRMLR